MFAKFCLNKLLKTGLNLSVIALLVLSQIAIANRSARASSGLNDKTTNEKVVWYNPKTQQEQVSYIQLPDWSRISLADFPSAIEGGSIGKEFNKYIGYDLSRVWQAGDAPATFLKLGDLADALSPQEFALKDILKLAHLNPKKIALSAFPLVGKQTLTQLVEAVPSLGNLQVDNVPPIAELLKNKVSIYDPTNTMIGQLITNPAIGKLKLDKIDLSKYALTSIPHLTEAKIENFEGWQNSFVRNVPGLEDIPLALMPNPISNGENFVARIDAVWSNAENKRSRTVSGSYKEGFSVPCQTNCAYIELDDLENSGVDLRNTFEGKQWISGKYQQVRGGKGVLGSVNGGKEPTGRHPFGKVFKVAVWNTSEASDRVSSAIFFRFCIKTAFVNLGCTPYFIGPIPFLNYHRDDWILLGK